MLDGAVDEVAYVGVGQGIEDVFARTAAGDDALGSKETKLLRDGREAYTSSVRQLGHAPFPVAQAMEQLQAGDVACRAKNCSCPLKLLITQDGGPGAPGMFLRAA